MVVFLSAEVQEVIGAAGLRHNIVRMRRTPALAGGVGAGNGDVVLGGGAHLQG